jgi:hypothetical protein
MGIFPVTYLQALVYASIDILIYTALIAGALVIVGMMLRLFFGATFIKKND